MSNLPAKPPAPSHETEAFWKATAEGTLLLYRCGDCESYIWYPRLFCPDCASQNVTMAPATGRGSIYSYTIVHRGQGRWREVSPYIIAFVELEEGPRMLTNIVECEIDAVCIDLAVEVVFDDTGEGASLPRFKPQAAVD